MIEIEVNLETKDYWKSCFRTYFSFNNLLFNFLAYTIFGWALSLLFLRQYFELSHVIDVILASVFFTSFTSFVWTYLSVNNAEKFSERKCKYIFTNEKVEIFAETFSSSINWKYFRRVNETGKYFVFQTKEDRLLLLPKRAFQEGEIIDFKNLIRTKFGNEAYLKKAKGNLGLK